MWKIIFIVLALLYVFNPYDILPDFFAGVGWLDDLIVLGFLGRYLYSLKKKKDAFQKYYRSGSQFQGDESGDYFSNKENFHSRANTNSSTNNPYQILGIRRNASEAEIKQAYRELVKKYHPDKVQHLGDEFKELAAKRFKEIQEAYQQLSGK